MGWKSYRLVYQAKSPIHIGWHTLGYIKLTRYYITGKAMWGAATANLTRIYGKENEPREYKVFGELLKTNVLISYFYPAVDPDIPLLPEFTADGLKYGGCTEAEFERLFIKSYGQTAVLPDSNTAEDESLHESEFIAPVVRDENTKEQSPVYFVGYIFIKDGAETEDNRLVGWDSGNIQLKGALSEIFVGGDRKYGWGRLLLDGCEAKAHGNKFFDYPLELDTDRPEITMPSKKPIPAHVAIINSLKFKGDIEPVVGREFDTKDKKGFGRKLVHSGVFWTPRSILAEDEPKPFSLCEYGIMESTICKH